MSSIGATALTPRGAAALAEASFRSKELPNPLAVIARVDWLVGSAALQLREVPRWLRGPDLLRLAEVVAENAPADVGAFLSEVVRVATRDQLACIFGLWFELDPSSALDQLVAWAEAGRVQVSEAWVRDGLELALGADERRTVLSALDLLARDAERARNLAALLKLIEVARDRLRPAEGRDFTVRWLREVVAAAPVDRDGESIDRAVSVMLEVLTDVPELREGTRELELSLILVDRASAEPAVALRGAIDARRPKVDIATRDVTTVTEALEATAERFPDLIVLPEAERSAARRGTGSVKKAREALLLLGEIAQRYATGELDQGLDEALATLPDFKQGISDSSKQQYRKDYARVLPDGRNIMLGPHFDIGGEDGRAYIYVDPVAKRIVLGHCGGHLRGKRDS